MRQIAQVSRSHDKTKRVMVYDDDQACYIFYFDTLADGPGFADTWHESMAEAKQICLESFGIAEADWQTVPDPQEGGQHDIITPTRVERGPGEEITFHRAV